MTGIRGITDHAMERAMERYGFAPTVPEIAQILEDCRTGKAPCLRKNEVGRQHVARIRDKLMIVCLSLTEQVIITVFPRDYFTAGSAIAHKQRAGHAKQKAKAAPNACNVEYNRAKWKREALADQQEDF